MGCGYFGKLPARSDYVGGHCPKGFLKLWEPFLMKGLARSRQDLAAGWHDAYMTMPVWRFTLEIAGDDGGTDRLAGALMPSVDGAGREFPLSVVGGVDNGSGQAPDDWYQKVETVLRGALREEVDLPGFQDAVAALPPPPAPQAGTGMAAAACPVLPATDDLPGASASRFWFEADRAAYCFRSAGLPDAEAFRWLLLPEHYRRLDDADLGAGHTHGRYNPETHRT